MSNDFKNFLVVSWNVRGLGDPDKCTVVKDALVASAPSVICLQETKLSDLSRFKAHSFLPPHFTDTIQFVRAAGSCGGILTAWNTNLFSLDSFISRRHTLTTALTATSSDLRLTVTNVYAPADHRDSKIFLADLLELQPQITGPWVLIGDFNLIRCATEKSTGNLDTTLCSLFNNTLDSLGVVELPLLDRLYTWSNKRADPVLARLDRAFVNMEQCSSYPNTTLTSLVRSTSDHTPLLITISSTIPKSPLFRFENAWLLQPTFLPSVLPAWQEAPPHADAAGQLASCLKMTRAAAKVWNRRYRAPPALIPNCKFLIMLLDYLEETRNLSPQESAVRHMCQERLAQAIKEKAAYSKQRGKRKAIREGDSNTKFFHAHATQRLRRNAIKLVEVDGVQLTAHEGKVRALTNYFKQVLGTPGDSSFSFQLTDLYKDRPRPSSSLVAPFSESEALHAVRSMNRCSALGPDGFGPSFYAAAWATVKKEVLQFLHAFHSGACQLERINRSYMVLIPKKQGAVAVDAFRPICLQNCSVKIAGKILTTRLQ